MLSDAQCWLSNWNVNAAPKGGNELIPYRFKHPRHDNHFLQRESEARIIFT